MSRSSLPGVAGAIVAVAFAGVAVAYNRVSDPQATAPASAVSEGSQARSPLAVVESAETLASERAALLERLRAKRTAREEASPPRPAAATAAPRVRAAAVTLEPGDRPAFAKDELGCLTAAVYYEARGEPLAGRRAVAQVVLNRVRDRRWPDTVCGVVLQRNARACQFSFVCDGSLDRPIDAAAWSRARALAEDALAGRSRSTVGAATHYHADYVAPGWSRRLPEFARVGSHLFYGNEDAHAGEGPGRPDWARLLAALTGRTRDGGAPRSPASSGAG